MLIKIFFLYIYKHFDKTILAYFLHSQYYNQIKK